MSALNLRIISNDHYANINCKSFFLDKTEASFHTLSFAFFLFKNVVYMVGNEWCRVGDR